MQKNSNIKARKLYELTRMLEISSIDVEKIMTDRKPYTEQVCITDGPGPPMYKSAMYGTVSIKDFKKIIKPIEIAHNVLFLHNNYF